MNRRALQDNRSSFAPILLLFFLLAAWHPGIAHSTLPGKNGFMLLQRQAPTKAIVLLNTNSGSTTILKKNATGPSISPSGKSIVFTQDGYLQTGLISRPHRFGQLDGATGYDAHPVFSPNGKQIYFQQLEDLGDASTLWRLPSNGGAPKRLYTFRDYVRGIDVAPDGRTLALSSIGTEYGAITFDLASHKTRLIPHTYDAGALSFSPDGERLTYDAPDTNGVHRIHVTGRSATDNHTLATGPKDSMAPVFSPDGKSIAYTQTQGDSTQILVSQKASAPKLLATIPGSLTIEAWQPSASAIVRRHSNRDCVANIRLFSKGTLKTTSREAKSSITRISQPGWHVIPLKLHRKSLAKLRRTGSATLKLTFTFKPEGALAFRKNSTIVCHKP